MELRFIHRESDTVIRLSVDLKFAISTIAKPHQDIETIYRLAKLSYLGAKTTKLQARLQQTLRSQLFRPPTRPSPRQCAASGHNISLRTQLPRLQIAIGGKLLVQGEVS